MKIAKTIGIHPRHYAWTLETFFLCLVGIAMIATSRSLHFGVVAETIVLVVMLGGLYGITRIPFPDKLLGKPIPLWAFPALAGIISGFLDSFIVLLIVCAATLVGPLHQQLRFKILLMHGALIGGLITYFGEVYMLPLALRYGMRSWHSMIPIVVPAMGYMLVLGLCARKLQISVRRVSSPDDFENAAAHASKPGYKRRADFWDYTEFAAFIILLLWTHNALLCLGALFVYSFVTGQGEDLIDVMKTETEVAVMLLLVLAAFISEPVRPLLQNFSGWWAFVPATVNGVITGAMYPAAGNVWREVHVLSTAVLLTPVSSLVGVMLFKSWREWKEYIKLSLILALIWFVICGAWFYGVWPSVEDRFYAVFPRPELTAPVAPNH